ncbi:unnamed protein product [Microthlaspi erraticum]|uniref:GCK domain-containing protein n=1 Tax=Microthlaspi erraticum TaxID=1685480 RepID=A0A6D2JCF2_9BRAS|nr:unnamed protein product [Microthlaspi erraticum]
MGIMSSTDRKTENPKSNSRNEPDDGWLPALREPVKAFTEGGECKDLIIDYIACKNEAEEKNEDSFTKCKHVREMLDKCYDAHSDYYSPIYEDVEPVVDSMLTEIKALFPPKQGREDDDDDFVEARVCEFMVGGDCKEAFMTALQECLVDKTEDDDSSKCVRDLMMLKKCMDAHSDYYQPILGAVNSGYQLYQSLLLSKLKGGGD